MRARPNGAGAIEHPRREASNAKANPLQHRREQKVLLETVTAAPVGDQLCSDTFEVEPYGSPEQHVDILERNMRRVCEVQSLQNVYAGLQRAGVPDALQIR